MVGGPFGSNLVSKDYTETGIPVIRGQNMGKRWVSGNFAFVSQAKAEQLSTNTAHPGDLVFTQRGTLGQVSIVPDEPFERYIVSQSQMKITVDPNLADAKFLYYYFSAPDQIDYVKTNAIQTGVPHTNLGILRKSPVLLPSLDTQKRIAKILSGLDDKIELNHQIIQTLEQMAQAIFKSWFVDFEPVKAKIAALEADGSEEDALLAAMQAISGKSEAELTRLQAEHPEQYAELRATAELFPSAMQDSELGEIPEGWGVDHLSELVQFNPRRSLKKGTLAPYLDMKNVPTSGHLAEDVVLREMNSGTKFVNGDTLLARITPCLENGKTAYVDFLDSDQVGWGSTEYIVMRSQEPYPESMSYFIARDGNFRQHAIQSMTGTSGRQRANAKALAELPWLIYPRRLTEEFDRIAAPYLKLAKSHGNQSKSLSAIRDSLLPKLLSGELDTTKVGA